MNVLASDHASIATAIHPDPAAQMIDIGDRRIAFASRGQGSPTVVLETGLGAESGEWAAIVRGVQTFTRVCRYDRAGRGASDCASSPRSALDMVDDLHRLLRTAEVSGPYVLVGHSFGGLLMRLYAHRYGGDVVGLVLVTRCTTISSTSSGRCFRHRRLPIRWRCARRVRFGLEGGATRSPLLNASTSCRVSARRVRSSLSATFRSM